MSDDGWVVSGNSVIGLMFFIASVVMIAIVAKELTRKP